MDPYHSQHRANTLTRSVRSYKTPMPRSKATTSATASSLMSVLAPVPQQPQQFKGADSFHLLAMSSLERSFYHRRVWSVPKAPFATGPPTVCFEAMPSDHPLAIPLIKAAYLVEQSMRPCKQLLWPRLASAVDPVELFTREAMCALAMCRNTESLLQNAYHREDQRLELLAAYTCSSTFAAREFFLQIWIALMGLPFQ